MKKYKIINKDGKEELYKVYKKDTLISVFSDLEKKGVKSIYIAGFEMKIKRLNKPIILHCKSRDYFSSISAKTTLKKLKEKIQIINEDIDYVSFDEKKIALKELREEDLKNYINDKKGK